MAIFKISFFCLCYFFARIAISACEPYKQAGTDHTLCLDEVNNVWLSEKCQKRDCDAKKFFIQHKSNISKQQAYVSPLKSCEELQIPLVMLTNLKGASTPYCLFNDGSVLDAATVGKLVL